MVRDAQADRRGAAGQGSGEHDVRALRDDDGEAAGPERLAKGRRGRRHDPDRGGLRRIGQQQHDPLLGWAPFHLEQALDPAGRRQRDGDPVDRVGREGDDASLAQALGGVGDPAGVGGDDPGGHAMRPVRRSGTSRDPGGPVRGGLVSQPLGCSARVARAGQDQRLDHRGHSLVRHGWRDVPGDRLDAGRR